MPNFEFPENCKIVEAIPGQVGAGAPIVGDFISLKNAHRAWAVISYNQNDANAITWRIDRDSTVAGALTVVSAQLHRIWSNLAPATSDLLVERTPAVNYTSDAASTDKMIIFEIDPTDLGDLLGVPYDCIRVASVTNIAAAQWVSAIYIVQPRYQSAVINQPSIIID